jgi:2-keto-4-pentenoate hydratase/2-oxohepta-3-ene-1,7-dioic acid hydratase in catechol pathway
VAAAVRQVAELADQPGPADRAPGAIAFISDGITLEPGDLILTGTPAGVGFGRKPPVYLADGDEVTIEIERVGSLTNPVQRA